MKKLFTTITIVLLMAACASWGEECTEDGDCYSDYVCVDCEYGGACGDDYDDEVACHAADNGDLYSGGSSSSSSDGGGLSVSDYDSCYSAWYGIDDYQVESHCMAACAAKVAGNSSALSAECGILRQFDSSFPSYCDPC